MSIKSHVLAAVGFLASVSAGWSQPEFLFEPDSLTVSPGANVFFQCVAFGDGPITYQWYKNDAALPGESSDFLFLNTVSQPDAGGYTVVASTFSGSVTSSVAVLALDGTFAKITSGPLVTDLGSSLGAAWGDYDNDGYPDVFVPKGGSDFNYLYHNNGDGTFTRVLSSPVVSEYLNTRNAAWADYDNDGWIDLMIANSGFGGGGFGGAPGTNMLFRNNTDGTFTRASAPEIGTEGGVATSLAWADFDRDGFLDVCFGINIGANFVYRNNRAGGFERISTGPIANESFKTTASLAFGDFNNDGAPDLIVANQPIGTFVAGNENFYQNNGDGSFTRLTNAITSAAGNSLSVSWVDYDNDLDLDLFIVNAGGQNGALYRNDGAAGLTPITTGALVNDGSESGNCTSAAWGDYDNDGWIDVYVTNDGSIGNFLYHNNRDGTFSRIEVGSPTSDRANSFYGAWVDVNHDGFLDLFVSNVSGENFLYRNRANQNHWLNVQLKGEISNRQGVGAKVKVKSTVDGVTHWQMREIGARDGSGGPTLSDAAFGLGLASQVDTLRIEWPSGIVQEISNVAIDQHLVVQEPPSVRITPGFVLEGDAGERSLLLPVTLTKATNASVTVDYFTSDLLATAGVDYHATNGTVTFSPNQTTQWISVTILGDLIDETNETFSVTLTNATVLPISIGRAVATILDDEPLTMSVADATSLEGDGSTNSLVFEVSLVKPVDFEVRVDYGTVGAPTISGVDYVATYGTLVFAPGQTSKPVIVPIIGDVFDENSETFFLNLSNAVNVQVVDAQGLGTILDDDATPVANVASITVVEGDSGTRQYQIEVTLTGIPGNGASVQYATSNLTAVAGLDYFIGAGTVQFPVGVTNRTITITVQGDSLLESNEVFLVNLFNPIRTVIGNLGYVTILDDDFKVVPGVLNGSGFNLSFASAVGRNYRVEWTGELSGSPVWVPVAGYAHVVGTGAVIQVTDAAANGDPRRFYRVILLAP